MSTKPNPDHDREVREARARFLAMVRERAAAESPDDPSVPRLAALLAQIRLDQAAEEIGEQGDR